MLPNGWCLQDKVVRSPFFLVSCLQSRAHSNWSARGTTTSPSRVPTAPQHQRTSPRRRRKWRTPLQGTVITDGSQEKVNEKERKRGTGRDGRSGRMKENDKKINGSRILGVKFVEGFWHNPFWRNFGELDVWSKFCFFS